MPMLMIQKLHISARWALEVGFAAAHQGHGVADERQHHQHVGTVEGQVAVGRSDLRAVRVVVDPAQVWMKPRRQRPGRRSRQCPRPTARRPGWGVRGGGAALSEQRHHEERDGFERGENTPPIQCQ